MDAFDSDVLIYAVNPRHVLGGRVRALLSGGDADEPAGIGSVLLMPEVLSKPHREGVVEEVRELNGLLARLDLRVVDEATADLATAFGAKYRLRVADAVHLATAVAAGADRFITNNGKDFPKAITEVDVTYPDDLPLPTD